jgi:hypothetical protein
VQAKQHACCHAKMKSRIGGAEQAGETRQSARGVLHVCFEEDVEPPFERNDTLGMIVRNARIANDEATRESSVSFRARVPATMARAASGLAFYSCFLPGCRDCVDTGSMPRVAAVIDDFGAQFLVPGFVAVDLA